MTKSPLTAEVGSSSEENDHKQLVLLRLRMLSWEKAILHLLITADKS